MANASTDLFARRRERFFDRVKEGVAILFATPEQHLSWDGEYRYRPDPDPVSYTHLTLPTSDLV